MKKTLTRLLSTYLIAATAFLGMAQSAQATMITSEQLVAQSSGAEQAKLASYLKRADVVSRLEQLGVSASDAKARVAAMSDEEAAAMNQMIDQAPAGGIIEVLVFIFLVLLITDILGFTKVFPFTRPIR